jgi:hypothetical protein
MHDDEPSLFEFMLRFFYNNHQDLISNDDYPFRSEESQQKHLFLPVQLYGIADKYDAMPLQAWAARVLEDNLSGHSDSKIISDEICARLVRAYYSECLKPSTTIGSTLAKYLVENKLDVIRYRLGDELIRQLPVFGADVLLVVRPNLWKAYPK